MNAESDNPDSYYAVIFSSQHGDDDDGYAETAQRMEELARQQPGFLGIETAHDAEGFGITVSYWRDLESIRNWKAQPEHLEAQTQGKSLWYSRYRLRIAKVEREYGWPS